MSSQPSPRMIDDNSSLSSGFYDYDAGQQNVFYLHEKDYSQHLFRSHEDWTQLPPGDGLSYLEKMSMEGPLDLSMRRNIRTPASASAATSPLSAYPVTPKQVVHRTVVQEPSHSASHNALFGVVLPRLNELSLSELPDPCLAPSGVTLRPRIARGPRYVQKKVEALTSGISKPKALKTRAEPVPDDPKHEPYRNWRRKINEAARRLRENQRQIEDENDLKCTLLEHENFLLQREKRSLTEDLKDLTCELQIRKKQRKGTSSNWTNPPF